MSSQVCSKPASTSSDDHYAKSIENRPLASFPPSIWGDLFHTCPEMNMDATTKLHEELKQEVQRMLTTPMDKPSQKLLLIDAVQRLGVAYHFEKEIEDALDNIYGDCNESFNKFKDEKGNFKASLISDVRGLLELYEAAHLRVHGENILEEALAFTTSHLRLVETVVEYPLSAEVASALKSPIRKNLPRLEARRYIPTYQACALHDETLLKFAKLDFNLLQYLHKKEISEIYRWWKDFEFSDKLPFIRDRVVEDYFWVLGVYFEPQYSLARRMMAKVIAMTSIIDDIYDAYGTFEELELFANEKTSSSLLCGGEVAP
ncbi:Terpene synthase [Theobroma cacao]|nr:Terpene synthase [Theobroma cacao]